MRPACFNTRHLLQQCSLENQAVSVCLQHSTHNNQQNCAVLQNCPLLKTCLAQTSLSVTRSIRRCRPKNLGARGAKAGFFFHKEEAHDYGQRVNQLQAWIQETCPAAVYGQIKFYAHSSIFVVDGKQQRESWRRIAGDNTVQTQANVRGWPNSLQRRWDP